MNSLKERTAKTKGITTLFISSALLIGFMGINLGLSQTASATVANPPTNPQCPGGTVDFQGGNCIGSAPTTTRGCADPDQRITGPAKDPSKQKCTGGQGPPNPVITITKCADPFTLNDGRCVAKPGKRVG